MTTHFISHRHHGNDGKNRTYQSWELVFRQADGSTYRKSFDSRNFTLEQVEAHRNHKIKEVGVMLPAPRRNAKPFPEEFAEWAVPHKSPASLCGPRRLVSV